VYQSSLEPWAALLTGHQGTDPGYDPLAFAVEQAHARGLELHAWINPFRAGNAKDSAALAPTHLFNARRDLVRVYGAQLWLDPGDTAVQEHVMRVLTDIVRRYDIDGIHADDYFYPYPEKDSSGRELDFPDSATYARSGSTLARTPVGEVNVAVRMREMRAVIGGEGNGGVILSEMHLGRDAPVGIALILQLLAERGQPLSTVVSELPRYAIVKDKLDRPRAGLDTVYDVLRKAFSDARVDTQDGLRLAWKDRWLHVRPSGTEPIVRVIAEAPTEKEARALVQRAREPLEQLDAPSPAVAGASGR